MLSSLGNFDRQVAEKLFAVHPEWQAYAHVIDDNGEGALIVSLDSPNPRHAGTLEISTKNLEVTVFFDSAHVHFDSITSGVIELVEQIISDHCCVVSFWRDEERCGVHVCKTEMLPVSNLDFPYANRIEIRSWSGLNDRDFVCAARD